MDLRVIACILGRLAVAMDLALLCPFAMSFYYGETSRLAFALTMLICGLSGVVFLRIGQDWRENFSVREGIAITGLGWIMVTLLGMLPYVLGGYLNLLDGTFESISGFTGTGATVIDRLETLPESILLWRSMTHWLGGLGIIVIFIAVLPQMGHSAIYMYKAEISGANSERLLPRLKDMALVLFKMYMGFTLVACVVFMLCGMEWLDAVNHAFSTIATGGFSTYDSSARHFDNFWIEGWMTFFMAASGVNFALYYKAWLSGPHVFLRNTEFRAYIGLLFAATVFIGIDIACGMDYTPAQAVRYATFQVASIATTGFVSADFDAWPPFSKFFLMLLMITGGCAGSTAGGLKIKRVVLLLKISRAMVWQKLHPRIVSEIRMNGELVSEGMQHRVCLFFFVYMMFIVFWALLLTLDGVSMFDAIGISVTTMGCVGPGFGIAGATCTYAGLSDFSKSILCISMMLGRLEIFTLLVMLRPSFWRLK